MALYTTASHVRGAQTREGVKANSGLTKMVAEGDEMVDGDVRSKAAPTF